MVSLRIRVIFAGATFLQTMAWSALAATSALHWRCAEGMSVGTRMCRRRQVVTTNISSTMDT